MTEGGDLAKLGRGAIWLTGSRAAFTRTMYSQFARTSASWFLNTWRLATRTAYARSYFERTGTKTTNLAVYGQ